MSDAQAFANSYKQSLAAGVADGIWPGELAAIYEPESCLKHTGAKEVYLVTDKRSGGRLVLRASDLDATERADAEHTILSRLDFPGIPKSYGTFVRAGRSYLAREYFEGTPLDEVIATRGLMHPHQIYNIARQLCVLLGYLHAQVPPVIHRDIKPQNIILRSDGTLGLTDFGIARTFKEGSQSDTTYMGTLPYAPPEQYGYAQSSPQTDIYALGIVLIYLATGSPDRRDLDKRIASTQLRTLIEKCIAFDPKNRFKNVEQIIKRIDSLKNRKLRIILGILIAVLVTILLGFGAWQLGALLIGSGTGEDPVSQQGALVDANEMIEWDPNNYPYTSDPRIGSTSWLYDYNNAGNLQGNINNDGFAVSGDYGRSSYVSNGIGIYEIDEDGEVVRQVYSGVVKGSLNIYGSYIYFVGDHGNILKVSLTNGHEEEIEDTNAEAIYFDNGRMYCINYGDSRNLYHIKTDGSSSTLASSATMTHYNNVVDNIRYYSDESDGYRIYAEDLSSGQTALLYNKPAHWLSVYNGRIYFDDEAGCLASIGLDGSDYKVVFDQPCYYVVATSHGIFAIDSINKELVVVDASTGEHTVLLDHDVYKFCVAGGWVYYTDAYNDSTLHMVREDGTDNRELVLD